MRVNAAPPTVAELGDRLVSESVDGGLIVKVSALDGAASVFSTVTLALPAEAIKLAGTEAVTWVALTKVVEIGEPFHNTVMPDWKPVPFTVSVNAGSPALAALGEILEMEVPLAVTKVTCPAIALSGVAPLLNTEPQPLLAEKHTLSTTITIDVICPVRAMEQQVDDPIWLPSLPTPGPANPNEPA